ncbi:hypothetical protein M0Q97_09730, partial [Candidatus Dojkabacteria bacterium]|nr:hypothetical protein [Candidatus Dojkabacteria bacterium]
MVNYNYLVDNFISLTTDKKTIKIFDKYGVLKYTFNPNMAYFFYKNNYVYIKVENDDDITLDFETNTQAIEALEKLNSVKKLVISNITSDIDYYTQTELDNGVLDNRYYNTSAITNILSNYLTTAATFAISDANDILLSGITNGEVLVYDNGVWVNSSFTFDLSAFTSDYYTIYELSSSTSGVYINWDNIINTPSGVSGYGIEGDIYNILSAFTYTKTELLTGTTGSNVLDSRYYVKTQTYEIIEVNDLLNEKTDLVDFYSHTGNTNNPHETTFYNLESTAHTHLISDVDNLQTTLNDKAELFDFQTHTGQTNPHLTSFNDLTLTSHTHLISDVDNLQTTLNNKVELLDFQTHTGQTNPHLTSFDDLFLTAHTHLWSELSNSSHTHDDRYYTEIELNPTGDATGSGELDVRYYTKIQTYEKVEINNMFNGYYNSGETNDLLLNYYTSAQTDTLLEQFSITSHTHTLNDLSGVTITTPQNNNFLIYSSGEWVNSAISFDVSNFYTKTELDNGQLNNIYIPLDGSTGITGDLIPAIDGIYSLGSATRQWKELHVSGGTIYIDGIPVTIINGDLYVNGELIPTSTIIGSNYSTTAHTHDDRYYTQLQLDPGGTTGTSVLDDRYYVKTQTYNSLEINALFNQYYTSAQTDLIFLDYYTSAQTDILLLNYYTSNDTDLLLTQYAFTSHTHNLEDLSNILISGVTNGQILVYSAGTWKNVDSTDLQSDLSGYYTSAQTDTLLLGKSNTGHTHNFNDLTLTSHTHLWSDITNSSHTHDDRYYTDFE